MTVTMCLLFESGSIPVWNTVSSLSVLGFIMTFKVVPSDVTTACSPFNWNSVQNTFIPSLKAFGFLAGSNQKLIDPGLLMIISSFCYIVTNGVAYE